MIQKYSLMKLLLHKRIIWKGQANERQSRDGNNKGILYRNTKCGTKWEQFCNTSKWFLLDIYFSEPNRSV